MAPTSGLEENTYEEKKEQTPPEDIIKVLFQEKQQYEEASKDQRKEVQDIFSAYMGKMDEAQDTPYATKESIPKLRTEVSYIVPGIFSGEPEVEVVGVGDEDKLISQILEKIVNYRLQQSIPDAYEKLEAWVKQSVVFGTSILKVVWRFKTEMKTEQKLVPNPLTGVAEPQTSTFESPIQDEPDFEVPNILDTYKNPIIDTVENQACIIFRSVLPVSEVQAEEMYDYPGIDGKPNRKRVTSKGNQAINQYDSSSIFKTDIPNSQKATEGLVEIYERITKDRIQTVADGGERLVLRDIENPYGFINAVKLIHEPNAIPNRFDGLGVGQNTLGLGKMYYKMFNQTLTGVTLTNNPMFIFEKGNGIDTRQLVAKPGGGIAVKADSRPLSDKIIPIQFPDVKGGAIDILNKMDDEHKRASGANDILQGSVSNDTAAQDTLANQNINNRFELIQRRFKHALAAVADMLIKMEIENLQTPEAEILRIFPEEARQDIFMLLKNGGTDTKYNIKVKGDTTIAQNKNIVVKQLLDWYNVFAEILTPQEKRNVGRRIMELRGQQNIDDLISEEAPQIDPMTGQPVESGMNAGMQPQNAAMVPNLNAGMNPTAMQPRL